jgi:hypothetical protein
MRKVKKEGVIKDRMFFCCPSKKADSCDLFDWAQSEDEGPLECFHIVNFSMFRFYKYFGSINITGEKSLLILVMNPMGKKLIKSI